MLHPLLSIVFTVALVIGQSPEPAAVPEPAGATKPVQPETQPAAPEFPVLAAVRASAAAKKPATVMDSVKRGKSQLQSWRTGYVKARNGEMYFAHGAIRIAILSCQSPSNARDVELTALELGSIPGGHLESTKGNPLTDETPGPFLITGLLSRLGKGPDAVGGYEIILPIPDPAERNKVRVRVVSMRTGGESGAPKLTVIALAKNVKGGVGFEATVIP